MASAGGREMRSPVSEVYSSAAEDSPVQSALEAEPYEIVSLRRDLDRSRKEVQELSKRVAGRNAQYLLREEELAQAIREAAEAQTQLESAAATKAEREESLAAVREREQRERATQQQPAADSEDPQQESNRRVAELEQEVTAVKEKIEQRRREEELAAVAVTRLKQQTEKTESDSANLLAQSKVVLESIVAVKKMSFQHRNTLAKQLNLEICDISTLASSTTSGSGHTSSGGGSTPSIEMKPSTMELELCPLNVKMDDTLSRLKVEAQQMYGQVKNEAELQASVFQYVEGVHHERKTQLEEQSEVLAGAQEALTSLQQQLSTLDTELDSLRERRKELSDGIAAEGTLEELLEVETTLRDEIDRTESSAATAQRARDAAKSALEAAQRSRKEVVEKLAEEELSLANMEGLHRTLEKQKDDSEAERVHIERSIRASKDNMQSLDAERCRLRDQISTMKEEKIGAAERQRRLEAQQDELDAALRLAERERENALESLQRKRVSVEQSQEEVESLKEKHSELLKERTAVKQKLQAAELERKAAERVADTVDEQLQYARTLLPKNHPVAVGSLRDARKSYLVSIGVPQETIAQNIASTVPPVRTIDPENVAPREPLAKQSLESAAALRKMLNQSGQSSRPPSKAGTSQINSLAGTPQERALGAAPPLVAAAATNNKPQAAAPAQEQHTYQPTQQQHNASTTSATASSGAGRSQQELYPPQQPYQPQRSASTQSSSSMASIQSKLHDILARQTERQVAGAF